MKQTLARTLIAALLLFPSMTLAAPINVNGGGTGATIVPSGAYLVGGSDPLRLSATTSPTAGIFTATSTTATSSLPRLSVSTAMSLLGEYITNLTTWVRAKIDAYLTGDQGITYSGGSLSFDCSEVEGTGIDCVGENITLDATGAWTGTFDGLEGTAYLARANHTGTQAASTITGGTFGSGSFIFPAGVMAVGSTTVGNGTQIGGLTVSGGATTTGILSISQGSVSAPGLSFIGDGTAGIYRNGSGAIALSGAGAGATWNGSAFYPNTDSARNLGIVSTNRWNNLFVNYASTTALSASDTAYFPGSGIWNSSGNVGIGTASPVQKLDIVASSGTGLASDIGFRIQDGTAGTPKSLKLGINTTGNGYSYLQSTFEGTAHTPIVLNPFGGNVGIGTTTPQTKLSVQGGTAEIVASTVAGAEAVDWPFANLSLRRFDNFTTMRMLQLGHVNDSTYQTGSEVWNLALVDNTGSKTVSDSNTDLNINGPGDLILQPTGNVGIGTTTPYAKLAVQAVAGDSNPSVFGVGSSTAAFATTTLFDVTRTGAVYAPNTLSSGSSQTGYWCYDAGGQLIRTSTTCLVSALRFKENIEDMDAGLATVLRLRPVTYDLKDTMGDPNNADRQFGFIAEEARGIDPRLVTRNSEGDVQSFRYEQFTAVLTKAIQDLNAKVDGRAIGAVAKRSAEENWQWAAIALLLLGLLYQQVQIKRLRK